MKVFDKIKFIVDKILERSLRTVQTIGITSATLGIMTVLVCYQVIARYVFNAPSAISEALSQYLFVWMIMFGSAYVYGSREHLAIDILKDRFSPKMYMIVEVITNIFLFAFILLICVWGGWLYTAKQAVQVDPSLHVSKAILYASVPFTGVITLYYAVYNCARAINNYNHGTRTHGDELSGTA